MIYLDVVLNVPVNRSFTYSYTPDEKTKAEIGMRVEVPFGNRKLTGFITGICDTAPDDVPKEKIRAVRRIVDDEPILTAELFTLAKWMADYYLCPLGEIVSAMIPSGRRETGSGGFSFTDDIPSVEAHDLSDEQRQAVSDILSAKTKHARFHYVYGPTGSGKTEVFLRVAEDVLAQNKGVIYLVPEIGLTPQVIRAVRSRFGNTAAVLHSGLTQSRKFSEWKRILRKEARVVVGARSAVFAPVPDLGLIIIDEEHDASYKSGTTPRYHARQVAMYRASRNAIPLVMGSATPSVESWHLMNEGSLVRHTLTKRLAGGAMPEIARIDLTKEKTDGCLSRSLANEIRTTLNLKKQTILFLNRRGFTHFFRCGDCGYEMTCKNCSVPMTYHKSERRLRCHYCGWSVEPPESCPACGSLNIGYSGFGTEYIEAETKAKFPNAKIVRIDTDALTKRGELEEKLAAFGRGEYDIMLGTQMVAKGLNFPNLRLVGIVLADTGLHIPDFRASERTFSLITQVAGRAGRFFPDGKVLVQTYNPSREPVALACSGDTEKFYAYELGERKLLGFPPFSRLVRLVFRSADKNAAEETAAAGAKLLSDEVKKMRFENAVEILGPAECPILKISQNYRYHLLLRGSDIRPLQKAARTLLFGYSHAQSVYIECDVDPVSLL
ncbi:replication restart helicase PriA [Treponema socranskii]|uniref:replication restart helicase PriA n=1 Tax=Treponema socranskii TaxID=53419 RepID=UPI003D910D92